MFKLKENKKEIEEDIIEIVANKSISLSSDLRALKESENYIFFLNYIKKNLRETETYIKKISEIADVITKTNKKFNNILEQKILFSVSDQNEIIFNNTISCTNYNNQPTIIFNSKNYNKLLYGILYINNKKNIKIEYNDLSKINVNFDDYRDKEIIANYYHQNMFSYFRNNDKLFSKIFFELVSINNIFKKIMEKNVNIQDIIGNEENTIEQIYLKLKENKEFILITTDLNINEDLELLNKQILKNKKAIKKEKINE